MTGWALDLDGVVWLADQPIPGAAEAIRRLRGAGHDVLFVSNNSSVPLRQVEDKLARFGIPAQGSVITSALVAAELVAPHETALLCAGAGVEEALLARGVAVVREGDADVVVVGFHREFDYHRLTVACAAVRRGARLLATNDDSTYPTPAGPIPGGGAILAAVVVGSGAKPVIAGKPHQPMIDTVRRRLGNRGVMIGDRPDTDGLFARGLGYQFGLVLSGVTQPSDLPVHPDPDMTAADLATLVDQLLDGGGAGARA